MSNTFSECAEFVVTVNKVVENNGRNARDE